MLQPSTASRWLNSAGISALNCLGRNTAHHPVETAEIAPLALKQLPVTGATTNLFYSSAQADIELFT